jgi:antitoxin HicB
MITYPAKFEPAEEGGFVITFPDFGWGVSQADDEAAGLEMATDLLETIIGEEVRKGNSLPEPSRPLRGKGRLIALPALASSKVELYSEFRRSGMTKSELARRTGINKVNIDRLFSLRHASRFDQIEAGFAALGKRIVLTVEDQALATGKSEPAENQPARRRLPKVLTAGQRNPALTF